MLSMRRVPLPGGGLLLLAALAVPILARSAKPLMKKVGKGIRDIGDKIVEATSEDVEPETVAAPKEARAKTADQPSTQAKTTVKKPRTARKPAAETTAKTKKPRSRPKKSLG